MPRHCIVSQVATDFHLTAKRTDRTGNQDRRSAAGEGFGSDGCRRTGQDAGAIWERGAIGCAGHFAGDDGPALASERSGGISGPRYAAAPISTKWMGKSLSVVSWS